MTDIVKRLQEGVFGSDEAKTDAVIHSYMQAGASEIKRLRAERAELRQLLAGLGAGIPAAAILRAEDRYD